MTIGVTTKRKKPPRMIACPDCNGARESVAVVNRSRDGAPMPGIENRNVACETCSSAGKVKARMTKACCCSGPKAERCDGCTNAKRGGSEIHVCTKSTEDEIAFETEMMLGNTPGTMRSDVGRNHPAADMGVGERSPHRGQR